MDRTLLRQLNEARRTRTGAVIVANEAAGAQRLIVETELPDGPMGEAALRALRAGKAFFAEIDGENLFFNPHVPPVRLVVIGAVHISQALAPMAAIAGYEMEIIDPRGAFATRERFPNVTLHDAWPDEVLEQRPLDAYTAVAAVTHDPKIDDPALIAALRADCFYVGALGSRKTHAKRNDRLQQAGLTEKQIARIQAPIGLDIGASTPQEIAVSVLAQLIETFRKRPA